MKWKGSKFKVTLPPDRILAGPISLGVSEHFRVGIQMAGEIALDAKTTSGAFCASSTGPASVRVGGRWNATSKRSGSGRQSRGHGLKKPSASGARSSSSTKAE